MSTLPKWSEEREATLVEMVGDESPVSQATVAEAAEVLETSTRSVSSKLRKMGFDVSLASTASEKKYTEEQEETLRTLVEDNSGEFTYADIAAAFEGGKFNAKQVQGKILSMELTSHVKPAEKKEVVKHYSDEEEVTFVAMHKKGASAEAIAEALGKTVQSVRGKGLSLLKAGTISELPKQQNTVQKVDPLDELGDLSGLTVKEIAEGISKTERGVKTMLTRRGLSCADYSGKDRKKAASE